MNPDLKEDDDPGGSVVVVAVGVDEADEVKERRGEGLDVSELLALQVPEVRGQRLEMGRDILCLVHCPYHVPGRGETEC